MEFTSLEEVREYFKNDKFATNAGMQVDSFSDDEVICSVELTDDHRNANGGIMGGAIFTLADLAFAVLVNNIHKPSVAAQVSINYLSAAKGTRLFASSKCIKTGRSTTVASVDVYDELGTKVALFTGTAFKL
ncbi:MAG: PaaI family thioesterase [Lachnospiraceae bacterium]|nr:PaaI family thioesterase [Lachnospiraceae bacterium]